MKKEIKVVIPVEEIIKIIRSNLRNKGINSEASDFEMLFVDHGKEKKEPDFDRVVLTWSEEIVHTATREMTC